MSCSAIGALYAKFHTDSFPYEDPFRQDVRDYLFPLRPFWLKGRRRFGSGLRSPQPLPPLHRKGGSPAFGIGTAHRGPLMLQMEQDTGFVPDLGTQGIKRELDVGQVPVAGKRRRLEEHGGASPDADSGGPQGTVAGDPQPRASGAGSSPGPPSVSGPGDSQAGSAPTAGPACGVRPQGDLGISWQSGRKRWQVHHRVRLDDGTSKQINKYFPLVRHQGPGMSEAEAREAALRAAREYRPPGGLWCALGRQHSPWLLQRRSWRLLGPEKEALASSDSIQKGRTHKVLVLRVLQAGGRLARGGRARQAPGGAEPGRGEACTGPRRPARGWQDRPAGCGRVRRRGDEGCEVVQ